MNKTDEVKKCQELISQLKNKIHELSYDAEYLDRDVQIAIAEELAKYTSILRSLSNLLKII